MGFAVRMVLKGFSAPYIGETDEDADHKRFLHIEESSFSRAEKLASKFPFSLSFGKPEAAKSKIDLYNLV